MRIVCDTNVLVSAVLFPGNPRAVLRLANQGRVENCISLELMREVEEVLSRPKFHLTGSQIHGIIELFQQTFTLVAPSAKVRAVPRDPDDNAVIEAAVGAGAAYIVSGDRDLLDLGEWKDVRIVSPAQFVKDVPC